MRRLLSISPYLIILLYLLLELFLLPYFDFYCVDFISYISIAKKYAIFDLENAVNAYWSPLFSWLMAPLLGLGLSNLISLQIVRILFGAGLLWQFYKLTEATAIAKVLQLFGMLTTMGYVVFFSLNFSTPDILLAYFILLYYRCQKKIYLGKRQAIFAGVVAAFAYFTKVYALVFILFHFVVIVILRLFFDREQLLLYWKNMVWFLITFLGIASVWIMMLSLKYDQPTFGSSGKYNWQIKLASRGFDRLAFPMFECLIEPPNNTAVSIWEDPPSDLGACERNFTERLNISFEEHFLRVITNVRKLGETLNYYNPFFPAILLGIFFLLLGRFREAKKKIIDDSLFDMVLYACLFPVFYLLLFFDNRYIWVLMIFLIYFGVFILDLLLKGDSGKIRSAFLALLFCLFALYTPIDLMYNRQINSKEGLVEIVEMANTVAKFVPPNSKIVVNDRWFFSHFWAHLNDYKFYGKTNLYVSEDKLKADLENFGVTYFLVYQDEVPFDFLKDKEKISSYQEDGVTIFKLRK